MECAAGYAGRPMNLARWFRQIWPTQGKRIAVIEGYRAIPQLTLADIALRGRCYDADLRDIKTEFDAGVRAGRQQLALEIIKIADAAPQHLFGYVERKPETEEPKR